MSALIWWVFSKLVSVATGLQAPLHGRPLLELVLIHLPSSQTETAPPLCCPSQSLTSAALNNLLHIYPSFPEYSTPSFPWSCPWSGSAYSSFLKFLTSSFRNCFACSVQHRLVISPTFTTNAGLSSPQGHVTLSSLPRELQP